MGEKSSSCKKNDCSINKKFEIRQKVFFISYWSRALPLALQNLLEIHEHNHYFPCTERDIQFIHFLSSFFLSHALRYFLAFIFSPCHSWLMLHVNLMQGQILQTFSSLYVIDIRGSRNPQQLPQLYNIMKTVS